MCYINNRMRNENEKVKKTIDNETKICYINNMKTCKIEKTLILFEIGTLFAVIVLIVINL